MDLLLSISIVFFVGLLFGKLARFVSLPNVTGYLIAGVLFGPFGIGFIRMWMDFCNCHGWKCRGIGLIRCRSCVRIAPGEAERGGFHRADIETGIVIT